jgi:hypothetical protein
MKTNLRLLGVAALLAAAATSGIVACSSDSPADSGPTAQKDSGTPNQPDTSSTTPPPPPSDDSGLPPIDAALPDAGDCKTDASTCNSCYTPQQDPVNGCSPATVNCIPFDSKRVPANAP